MRRYLFRFSGFYRFSTST